MLVTSDGPVLCSSEQDSLCWECIHCYRLEGREAWMWAELYSERSPLNSVLTWASKLTAICTHRSEISRCTFTICKNKKSPDDIHNEGLIVFIVKVTLPTSKHVLFFSEKGQNNDDGNARLVVPFCCNWDEFEYSHDLTSSPQTFWYDERSVQNILTFQKMYRLLLF